MIMRKLNSRQKWITYSCNHEEFPGVTVLFQTIHSNMIKEKDEEIERLPTEIENLMNDKKGKKEHFISLRLLHYLIDLQRVQKP